jgi:hypothetical protein
MYHPPQDGAALPLQSFLASLNQTHKELPKNSHTIDNRHHRTKLPGVPYTAKLSPKQSTHGTDNIHNNANAINKIFIF